MATSTWRKHLHMTWAPPPAQTAPQNTLFQPWGVFFHVRWFFFDFLQPGILTRYGHFWTTQAPPYSAATFPYPRYFLFHVYFTTCFVYFLVYLLLPPHHLYPWCHLPTTHFLPPTCRSLQCQWPKRHIVWANGNLFHFISFILITDTAMSPLHQQCHCPPPACSLHHQQCRHQPFTHSYIIQLHLHCSNGPNDMSRHVIWTYSILFYFCVIHFNYRCCHVATAPTTTLLTSHSLPTSPGSTSII